MVLHLAWYLWVAIFVMMDIIRPKPKLENARPAGLGDFNFPTATEGRVVPLIWGRVEIKGPNVVWYGGFLQQPRTQRQKTGIFSSQSVVIGYKYYVGMHFALCRGVVGALIGIKLNDRLVTLGRVGTGVFDIAAPNALGGEDLGQGGIEGAGYFYSGAATDAQNAYMQSQLGANIPAFRGTCQYVFEGGYVGTSTSIPPISFIVERIPDGLGLAAYHPGAERVNLYDANPMNVAYEILTDSDWGLHISTSLVDTVNFQEAAVTLHNEGNGFSLVLDREMEAVELLKEIERQIDGLFYFDKFLGQWKVVLDRFDYDEADLLLVDSSNLVELAHYSRATWEETTNQVNLKFQMRSDNFREAYAMAQDMANYTIQGGAVSVEVVYPGVKDAPLANRLAWRDLRTLSYPLAKAEIVVNRTLYQLIPGSAFKFTHERLGVENMIMRVTRVDYGQLGQGQIRISCVEDVFSVTGGAFGDPPSSGWVDPSANPGVLTAENILAFEAPRQLVAQDTWRNTLATRIWHGARNPGGGTTLLVPYYRTGSSRPLTGDFTEDEQQITAFALAGSLQSDLPAYFASAVRPSTDHFHIVNNDPDDLSSLDNSGGPSAVEDLGNIAYIDGEFIGYEELKVTTTTKVDKLYRGLFHTAPKAHAAGTRVWLLGQTGGNLTGLTLTSGHDEVDTRLYGRNRLGVYTAVDPPTLEFSIQNIAKVPLAPRDPVLDIVYAPATASLDTSHAGHGSGDNNRGIYAQATPRDWHQDNVHADMYLSSEYLDDNPEFDFALVVGSATTTPVTYVMVSAGIPATIDDPEAYLTRNSVIKALGAGVQIPATAQLQVTARHTVDAVEYTNPVKMLHDFTLTSALQGADLIFGAFAAAGSTGVTFGETGTYAFDIHYALPSSGIVESNVNSGGWTTLIGAAATTGNLSLTASDVVQLRFSVVPAADQFFDIAGPTEVGYGVLLH